LALLVIVFFVCQSLGFALANQLQEHYYFTHRIDEMGGGLGVLIAYLMLLTGPYYCAWVFIVVLCGLAAIDLVGVRQFARTSQLLRWVHSSRIWWYLIPDAILAFAFGMKMGINWHMPFWS
jgi:hypothetical protein